MRNEKYMNLDKAAAPNNYVAIPSVDDLAYVIQFRQTCRRYHIDFSTADDDKRDFVIRMAEKSFIHKHA